MTSPGLDKAVKVLFFFFLVFAGLYFAKPFLAPFAIAALLATLFLPLARKMEKKGMARGFSAFICDLILATAIAGIVILVSTQVAGIAEDAPKLKENISKTINKVKEYIGKNASISPEQQKQVLEQQKGGGGGNAGAVVTGILNGLSGLLVDTILVFVYIFLLLYLRTHIKKAILQLVPANERESASKIISTSSKVVVKYLSGLAMMIVLLWVMYGIGFSVVGVKNAIFFAILCGLLEIIPFVGNITGTGITIIMALTQGGGGSMVIGILITYAIVQFVQTYILEPLIVGSEVNLSPLFTIVAIVIGELVWGVPGMVMAIPATGVIKVICDNVESLKPIGFLIGEEKKEKGGGLMDKVKGWFSKG